MRIRKYQDTGSHICLRKMKEMMEGDELYANSLKKKYLNQLQYLRKLEGFNYDKFFNSLLERYHYFYTYPLFLLDELIEPNLLDGYEEIIHLFINNWLYDQPLDDSCSDNQLYEFHKKRLQKLLNK